MSFGFSVGDLLTVGKLVADISGVLAKEGGAKSEYQELLRELESLQNALQRLDQLQADGPGPCPTIDSIKYAALSCRRPLEDFLSKIQRYETSLGVWGNSGIVKNTKDKFRFALGHGHEIQKLRNYLNIHVGTLNILLMEHGLEKIDVAYGKADAEGLCIRERLDNTRGMIQSIGKSVVAQVLLVRAVYNKLTQLYNMVSGEMKISWTSLCDTVAKIW